MRFKVIGSNSDGNGYLLESSTDTLLIECGMSWKKIKQALNFKISNVSAIVSHSHGDHSKSMAEVMNVGINVYAGAETFAAKGLQLHHRAKFIEAGKIYNIGSFRVKPFEVNHDVPCFGFMIMHEEMGLCIFLTDTCFSNYTFPKASQIVVECNHDSEILENNSHPKFLKNRIIGSHMNLNTCREFLLANDLSTVNNIVLIHLSDSNSDEIKFKKDIQQHTGKVVTIAEPGLVIENFNKRPF